MDGSALNLTILNSKITEISVTDASSVDVFSFEDDGWNWDLTEK